jgi:ribosomal protein S18 acetylase RimI-like enzyme
MTRKMRQNDLETVSNLSMLANPHAEKERYKSLIVDLMKSFPDLAFVAVCGGKVVGYIMGDVKGGKGCIEDIAVDVKHQRKGIGKQLMDKGLAALKKGDATVVVMEVHYKQASAIPLYHKLGFRISGCRLDFFGLGHDAIFLERAF